MMLRQGRLQEVAWEVCFPPCPSIQCYIGRGEANLPAKLDLSLALKQVYCEIPMNIDFGMAKGRGCR